MTSGFRNSVCTRLHAELTVTSEEVADGGIERESGEILLDEVSRRASRHQHPGRHRRQVIRLGSSSPISSLQAFSAALLLLTCFNTLFLTDHRNVLVNVVPAEVKLVLRGPKGTVWKVNAQKASLVVSKEHDADRYFLDINHFINYQSNWIVYLLQISRSFKKRFIAKLTFIIIVRQLYIFLVNEWIYYRLNNELNKNIKLTKKYIKHIYNYVYTCM